MSIGKMLTVSEVQQRLGLSRMTVYRMIKHGTIPSLRVTPRGIRVPEESLNDWLQQQVTVPVEKGGAA